jgi:hypothetical protein
LCSISGVAIPHSKWAAYIGWRMCLKTPPVTSQ